MKRSLVLLIAAGYPLMGVPQLLDPGFEQGNSHWQFTCPDDAVFTGSTAPGGGTYCTQVTMVSPTEPDCYHFNGTLPFVFQELPGVQNGDQLSLTFWHRGLPTPPTLIGSLGLIVGFGCWAPPIVEYGGGCGLNFYPTYDTWGSLTVTCTLSDLPPGATASVFLGGQATDQGNGMVQFDNVSLTVTSPSVRLAAKAWMDGAFDPGTTSMRDNLRSAGLLPLSEPYSALLGGAGGETTTAPVLSIIGPNAIVDWVRLELRSGGQPEGATVAAVRHALLQRDGDIVDVDGTSPVSFNAAPGNYFVALRHRNHLGVMTAAALALSAAPTVLDLRDPATNCHVCPAPNAGPPRRTVNTTRTLWAGNCSADAAVKYTGSGNDRDAILLAVGSTTPNNTVNNVYDRRDTNLDGVIKYTGTGNDRDIILTNVGSTTPNAVRVQQLP